MNKEFDHEKWCEIHKTLWLQLFNHNLVQKNDTLIFKIFAEILCDYLEKDIIPSYLQINIDIKKRLI